MTTPNPVEKNSPSKPNSPTGKLSNWISSTNHVPPSIQTRAKYLLLDGVACALVGAHLPWSETATKAILNMEPTGHCTVIGWGSENRLSPMAAALLNSTFIQGFELDDYHAAAPLHSNSFLIPALLSASKVKTTSGKRYTGADFLHAYIVGCEVGPRVGLALHGVDLLSRGWHSGALQGPAATAAAVSAFLHLPPNQVEDALGIACTQAGGLMSAQFGSMAKRMQHGFASRSGLLAACLAQGGYTGIHQVFEQPYGGFLSCFSQGANFEPKYLPDEIVKGLGEDWEIRRIKVKLHASMAALHGAIDCVANLQRREPERMKKLDEIETINTRHGKAAFEHGGWKADPHEALSSTGAQMSIQYATACQLIDGQVLAAQFSSDKLNRPQLRELMTHVTPTHDENIDKEVNGGWRTVMTVRFKDGTILEENVAAPIGVNPEVSNEQVVEKWRSLVKDIIPAERMYAIEEYILNIDIEDGLEKLCALLEPMVKSPIEA